MRREPTALLLATLWCLGAAAFVGAQPITAPGAPDAAPRAAAPLLDEVRARFEPTRGWFRIVQDARFDVDARGGLTPDYRALHHPRVRPSDAAGYAVVPTFPASFRDAARVAIAGHGDLHLDVTPLAAAASRARVEGGLVVYPGAWVDTDVMFKSTPTHVDEYLYLRSPRAPTTWRYRVALGPGLRWLRQTPGAVEALDARRAARLRANRPVAVDAAGRRVEGDIRVVGGTLVLSVDLRGATFPVLVDPDWRPTADMAYGRFYNGAHVLPDGRVLVTGGCSASVCSGDLTIPACRTLVASAEALDLATRTWSRAGDDPVPRFFHASESLADGSVLVAGGCTDPECATTTADVRVYEPARQEFRAAGALSEARAGVASVRLRDGRVLLAGGCGASSCTARVEVFDPAGRTLRRGADLGTPRGRATVTLLADGTVLVAGGCTSITCASVLASAEVYDPASDTWRATEAPMGTARAGHFAARRDDGTVVLGGGCPDRMCTTFLDSTERYDPSTRRFAAGPRMRAVRLGAQAVRLPDGALMVAQGCQTRTQCDLTNELLDPRGGAFAATESALTIRAFHQTIVHEATRQVISLGGCQPRTCSWWNETWDFSHLVPVTDAGLDASDAARDAVADVGVDVPTDAARDVASLDAAVDAPAADGTTAPPPPPPPPSDCACRAVGVPVRGPRSVAALLGLLGLLVARSRRRAP